MKCNGINGDYNDHDAGEIRREAHHPMEHIGGFMQSHYMPPSCVCLRRIGPADAMVIAVAAVWNATQNITFS